MTANVKKKVEPADRYTVGTLEKGLSVLEALEKGPDQLTIQEIARVTGIQRAAVFRLLCTLERRGYVMRLENKKYRATSRRRRILIGYSAPLAGTQFRVDLAESLRKAASRASVDLLILDNPEDDVEVAQQNARQLLEARVDVAIMFQPIERIGHIVGDRFAQADTPFITIEVPVPGGVYFGANNFQAGKMAGRTLARFAEDKWQGKFDRLVLLESSSASSNVQARLAGVVVGVTETLGAIAGSHVVHLDGFLHEDSGRRAMAELLAGVRRGTRLLISCFNDNSAMGALEAVRAARREADVAIVGQNATESRSELRNVDSRLIASIAYFPERYGTKLVGLALSILNQERVPPAVYADHVVLERRNIDKYYARR